MIRLAMAVLPLTAILSACTPSETRPPEASVPATAPAREPAAPVTPASATRATNMRATTYDDGHSCPNQCDAHVVFRNEHNGTRNAFLPGAAGEPMLKNRSNPAAAKCVNGRDCVICFDDSDASCMVALYRGRGPDLGRFDFTPAFIRARCDGPNLPARFAAGCRENRRIAAELAQRVNCIANPQHARCREIMQSAVSAKQRDVPEYARCKQIGVARYNAQQPDPQLHRHPSIGCEYFLNQRGNGWFKLVPGACRQDYFVGPHGTDCCSADPSQAAIDRVECGHFYR